MYGLCADRRPPTAVVLRFTVTSENIFRNNQKRKRKKTINNIERTRSNHGPVSGILSFVTPKYETKTER